MCVYVFLFLILMLSGISIYENGNTYKRTSLYGLIAFICIFGVECLRDISVGEDTVNYVAWFNDFCVDGWKKSFVMPRRYVEPGYKILNLAISYFTHDYRNLIIISSLIIVGLFICFLKKNSNDFYISIMMFLGMNFFTNSMTAIRQFIAMGIVFWMLPLLNRKKWNRALLVAIVAFLFHHSSIIFILAVVCFYLVRNNYYLITLVLLSEILVVINVPILLQCFLSIFPKYDIYFKYGEVAELGKLRIVYIVLEIMLLVYYFYKKSLHSEYNNIVALMVSSSVLVGVLNAYVPHIFRLGYYFDFYLILFVPILFPTDGTKKRTLWELVTIFVSFLFFMYYLFTNAGGIVPYKAF